MRAVSKFQRGQSTYTCQACEKLTRDTGYGEAGCSICKKCYVQGGLENEHSDYGHDSVQFEDGIRCPSC